MNETEEPRSTAAVRLRDEGKTYKEIADALGVAHGYAPELVRSGREMVTIQDEKKRQQVARDATISAWPIRDVSVSALDLPPRVARRAKGNHIRTIGDLMDTSDEDFLCMSGVGWDTVTLIRQATAALPDTLRCYEEGTPVHPLSSSLRLPKRRVDDWTDIVADMC